MKKYIISLLVSLFALVSIVSAQEASLATETTSPATLSATAGFEGQYVFRGQKITDNVASLNVSLTAPTNTTLSIDSYWNARGKDASTNGEFDATLSQEYSVDDVTTITVGGVGYFYPKADAKLGETKRTLEAFAAISYEAFLNPTATIAYDFYLQQIAAEGSLSTDVKLPFLAKNWKLVPAIAVGFVTAKDSLPEAPGKHIKDSYYYATAQVDLVYEIKNVVLAVGYRYNHLDNSNVSHNSWVGGAATLRF